MFFSKRQLTSGVDWNVEILERKPGDREKMEHEIAKDLQKEKSKYRKYELHPSEAEWRIVGQSWKGADEIARGYGGSSKPLENEKFMFVKKDTIGKVEKGEFHTAVQTPLTGLIVAETTPNPVNLSKESVHEFLHRNGRTVVQETSHVKIHVRRTGLSIVDRQGERRFEDFEEALIAKLTNRHIEQKLRTDPQYTNGFENGEGVKQLMLELIDESDLSQEEKGGFKNELLYIFLPEKPREEHMLFLKKKLATLRQNGTSLAGLLGYLDGYLQLTARDAIVKNDRVDEQRRLDAFIQNIISRAAADGSILDPNDIFDEFARAHFTGNLLPLARIIEKTLGRGSFRKVAEEESVS